MKKGLILISTLLISHAYADIPYCSGTKTPPAAKNDALQYVVTEYARMYHCNIGNNCLLNFDTIKYSISWVNSCNLNSTFICENGNCYPYGYSAPKAHY